MDVVEYLRISQDRTGEAAGVDRQRKENRAYARKHGLRIAATYVDNDQSATRGTRPEFERMLAAHPAAILAWHQDRLLRLTKDLERVIALDVPVYTTVSGTIDLSTPAGRAVARTVAAWSQYEGEQKALRQKSSNLQRAERGRWHFSRRPYGYQRTDGRVKIVPEEAVIVRETYSRYLAGESYYAIAADFTEWNVPTFGGGWSMTRVRQLLRNEHYAGLSSYNGKLVEPDQIEWEPLIDRDTWREYTRMRDTRKASGSWSRATKHLLGGLAVCGVCESRMTARPDHGRQTYACTTNWCVSRLAAPIDDLVTRIVLARLSDPKIIAGLRDHPDTAPLETELRELHRRRDDIADLVGDGLLDRQKAREKAGALTTEVNVLTRRLDAMRIDSPLTDLALAESIPATWEALPVVDKRRAIAELGLNAQLHRGQPGVRAFNPDTVEITWEGEPRPLNEDADLRPVGTFATLPDGSIVVTETVTEQAAKEEGHGTG